MGTPKRYTVGAGGGTPSLEAGDACVGGEDGESDEGGAAPEAYVVVGEERAAETPVVEAGHANEELVVAAAEHAGLVHPIP